MPGFLQRFLATCRGRRVSGAFFLSEAAGSLGDLGTFVPIVVAMVQIVGLDAATILVFAGLMNVLTGLAFRIPIPVQPMKAIAALAIAGSLTAPEVAVAGVTVGLLVLLMAVLGIITHMDRLIPLPLVRGMQLMLGLQLLLRAARLALFEQGGGLLRPVWGPEGLSAIALCFALLFLLRKRLAYAAVALVLFGLLGVFIKDPGLLSSVEWSGWRPLWVLRMQDAPSGLIAGLFQVPMTLLNSVFAVVVLARELLPERTVNLTPTRVTLSVGLMNLLSCPLGAMPVCHGAGGLAGQFHFGARSGVSMIMLGTAKLAIGLFLGVTALAWMRTFPSSVLCVFLAAAAAELVRASRCWETPMALGTGAAMILTHSLVGLSLAFPAGCLAYAIFAKVPWNRVRRFDRAGLREYLMGSLRRAGLTTTRPR